jgi:cytochrome c553
MLAPAIAGLDQWYIEAQIQKFKSGIRGAHPDDVGGLRMRPMSRTLREADEVRAVSAYVAALPAARPATTLDGDATRGGALYAPCIACHGPTGEGMQALGAPSLTRTDDWYQLKQLKHFKVGIRGGPGDGTGILMVPMAATLPDEQAMKDVIAHIQTLGR